MKRLLKIWTIALVAALGVAACDKNEENPADNSGAPANNLKPGEVQISGAWWYFKRMSISVEAKTLTIDWGDGSTETLTPNGEVDLEHTYAVDKDYDIYLQTTGLTSFEGAGDRILFGECDLNNFEGSGGYLDFSKCPKLANLGYLMVDSLNIANCAALKAVRCTSATWINVRGCTSLEELDLGTDGITSLDVSSCTALKSLSCGGGGYEYDDDGNRVKVGLTSLDVSKNTKLESLLCYGNQLTSLDLSKNTKLEYLDCGGNPLTSLDVSKNTALISLQCSGNQLDAAALNALFQGLPTLQGNPDGSYNYGQCNISYNPGATTCDVSIAEKKGWKVSGGCAFCTITITGYAEGGSANSQVWVSKEYCGAELTSVEAANGANVTGADAAKGGKYVVSCE